MNKLLGWFARKLWKGPVTFIAHDCMYMGGSHFTIHSLLSILEFCWEDRLLFKPVIVNSYIWYVRQKCTELNYQTNTRTKSIVTFADEFNFLSFVQVHYGNEMFIWIRGFYINYVLGCRDLLYKGMVGVRIIALVFSCTFACWVAPWVLSCIFTCWVASLRVQFCQFCREYGEIGKWHC